MIRSGVSVVVRMPALQLAPELRVCGSYSAKYGPPIGPDLGKRESIVGSARTVSVGCVLSGGNVVICVPRSRSTLDAFAARGLARLNRQ